MDLCYIWHSIQTHICVKCSPSCGRIWDTIFFYTGHIVWFRVILRLPLNGSTSTSWLNSLKCLTYFKYHRKLCQSLIRVFQLVHVNKQFWNRITTIADFPHKTCILCFMSDSLKDCFSLGGSKQLWYRKLHQKLPPATWLALNVWTTCFASHHWKLCQS